jgi:hypothetical protein
MKDHEGVGEGEVSKGTVLVREEGDIEKENETHSQGGSAVVL